MLYISNLKNLKNYRKTLAISWQNNGIDFFVSKKVSKVSRKCLKKCEKCLAPR